FELVDGSIAKAISGSWTTEARRLIEGSDCVIVLCGEQTHQAKGVVTEVQIAQELGKRYFLLQGTRSGRPSRPPNARATDKIWAFRWPTVSALLDGKTPPSDAGR
ncbi:MAG TPA: TIR domain-containing protein, partial [Kofleriaceae bacterium]